MYFLGARSRIVLCLTKSLTDTTPLVTRVSVVVQVSCTSHVVPRTVAALYWPRVRKEPEPLPHSLRDFGFLADASALPPFGHASASVSCCSVTPPASLTLKMP